MNTPVTPPSFLFRGNTSTPRTPRNITPALLWLPGTYSCKNSFPDSNAFNPKLLEEIQDDAYDLKLLYGHDDTVTNMHTDITLHTYYCMRNAFVYVKDRKELGETIEEKTSPTHFVVSKEMLSTMLGNETLLNDEIRKLNERNSVCINLSSTQDKKIESLNLEVETLRNALREIEDKLEECNEGKFAFEQLHEECMIHLDQCKLEKQQFDDFREEIEQKLQQCKLNVDKADELKYKCFAQTIDLQKEAAKQRSDLSTCETEKSAMKKEYDAKLKEAVNELEKFRAASASLRENIEITSKKLETCLTEKKGLESVAQEFKTVVSKQKEELDESIREMKDLNKKFSECEVAIKYMNESELAKQLKKEQSWNKAKEELLAEQDQQIKSLNKKVIDLTKKLDNSTKLVDKLNFHTDMGKDAKLLIKETEELREDKIDLKVKNREALKVQKGFNEKIRELTSENNQLKADLQAAQKKAEMASQDAIACKAEQKTTNASSK
jgi:chromosome segregation ATPase